MSNAIVRLVDKAGNLVATTEVANHGAYFGGTIDLRATPPSVRALFDEFEEVVNDQVFTVADEIQEKLEALSIKAVFEDGTQADLYDLQVFPTAGDVSFRLVGAPALATKSA